MMRTVRDFLKAVDASGCHAVFWMKGEDKEPCWEGPLFDTPWWVAELKLDYKEAEDHLPISYRDSLGIEHNDRPGFVIRVKEGLW